MLQWGPMVETCPKCGYDQVETDKCPRCLVIISKYRVYLESLGKPPSAPVKSPLPPSTSVVWSAGSPAGFWIRGAALFVDAIVFYTALLLFALIVMLPPLMAGGIGRPPDPARVKAVNAGYFVVSFVLSVGYSVWMHGRWGQTLGKMATGVRVVKPNGEPIGYGRALGRWFASILSFITFGIGYLMAGVHSEKRALHDLVAGTRVIKVRRPSLDGRSSGFWMRYVALSLDWQVLAIPGALVGILVVMAIPFMAAGGQLTPSGVMAMVMMAIVRALTLFLLVALIGHLAYSVGMHGRWGQTLGKMALGMQVVRTEGGPLGYGGAFVRWIGSLLWAMFLPIGYLTASLLSDRRVLGIASLFSVVALLISYLMAASRSDKRALHDLLAGTRVTYVR